MNINLIKPYGYCVGVEKVINSIKDIVNKHSKMSVFCIGQVVHNKKVNENIEKLGVKIINKDKAEAIDLINEGVVIFSAHGTDEKIIQKAKEKGLIVYDLVCPFVLKSFCSIKEKIKEGHDIIYIGVNNHEESAAALSISKNIHFVCNIDDVNNLHIKNEKISVINQTTLSILDIKNIYDRIIERYPNATIIDEICGSTRIRQEILLNRKLNCDGIIIVGDENSNNSKSLFNCAKKQNYDAIFVSNYEQIDLNWIKSKNSIAIMSGASSDNKDVEIIFDKLKTLEKGNI